MPEDRSGALRVFEAIGSDRYLHQAEVCLHDDPFAHRAWDVYEAEFGRLTGATADPAFRRLDHPAIHTGQVVFLPEVTTLVVGAGPSLDAHAQALRRHRESFYVVTSPRGAAALGRHGMTADLVLVSDASALEATLTLQSACAGQSLDDLWRGALVAADARTPHELIATVPPSQLFLPLFSPSWSWWPAAAIAMVVEGGCQTVALLGVDAGTPTQVARPFEPLVALLTLLAEVGAIQCFDCGAGASKAGWLPCRLESVPRAPTRGRVSLEVRRRTSIGGRLDEERLTLERLRPYAEQAAATTRCEAGRLDSACDEMLRWADDAWLRCTLQERLGLSFLPCFWRVGLSGRGARRARAARLALGELSAQYDRLAHRVGYPVEPHVRAPALGHVES